VGNCLAFFIFAHTNITMTDPSPYFIINQIDISTVYRLYPDMPYGKLEEYIKSMDDEQRSKATIDVTVHSSIVVNHKKFDKYNDLYAELSKAQLAEDDRIRQEAQIAYDRSIKALGTHITEDIKDKFVDAININERITNQLKPHINTLFFISLSFYDHYWDTFGENFNGALIFLN